MIHHYSEIKIAALNRRFEQASAREMITWATETFQSSLTFACSFGAEDMVVLDLLLRADPEAHVFLLDTGRLPQETYDVIERSREYFGRDFTVFVPMTDALETLLQAGGPNEFYRSREARQACCRIRKVEPLARALNGRTAWLTGLRREQSVTRSTLPFVEGDAAHGGMLKLNPLAEWSEAQVWAYIREHALPYNRLYDNGFSSIGCAPCTRAVRVGEELRAGRWWWETAEQKECGLHLKG